MVYVRLQHLDSCGGQNRNFKVATLLSYMSQHHGLDVTLHFMQSGLSFLSNDADFGVIQKSSRHKQGIYIPQHWMDEVARAHKRKPFTVVNVKSADFIDLEAMSRQLVNRKKCMEATCVNWLQIQTIRFLPDDPYIMRIQYVCDSEAPWYMVDLRRSDEMHLMHTRCEQRKLNFKKSRTC